jgi:hypothetical protein
MVELTSTSASNGTRNWYLYWYRCISSVDVFIIDLRIKDPQSLYLKASCSKQMIFSKEQNVETLIPTLIELFK